MSKIPSESGVYGIFEGESCVLVGEAWNLKARLLELVNSLQQMGEFRVQYELCEDEERVPRKQALIAQLQQQPASSKETLVRELPGISFWSLW